MPVLLPLRVKQKAFICLFPFIFLFFFSVAVFLTDRERLFEYISSFVTQDGVKRIGLL